MSIFIYFFEWIIENRLLKIFVNEILITKKCGKFFIFKIKLL